MIRHGDLPPLTAEERERICGHGWQKLPNGGRRCFRCGQLRDVPAPPKDDEDDAVWIGLQYG